jgi:hypothetical protein
MTSSDKRLHLKRDFEQLQKAHSWYKHLAILGQIFFATYDENSLSWRFTDYEPTTATGPVYAFEVGAFLRGCEPDRSGGYVQGVTALVEDCYDDLMKLLAERYPEWLHLDWHTLSLTPSNPIVCKLFRRESQRYYEQLVADVFAF